MPRPYGNVRRQEVRLLGFTGGHGGGNEQRNLFNLLHLIQDAWGKVPQLQRLQVMLVFLHLRVQGIGM